MQCCNVQCLWHLILFPNDPKVSFEATVVNLLWHWEHCRGLKRARLVWNVLAFSEMLVTSVNIWTWDAETWLDARGGRHGVCHRKVALHIYKSYVYIELMYSEQRTKKGHFKEKRCGKGLKTCTVFKPRSYNFFFICIVFYALFCTLCSVLWSYVQSSCTKV